MWQWFRFLLSNVQPHRQVLLLNLDETSIRFWYAPRLGLRQRASQVPRQGFARQASRSQLRKAFSHVAIICDDSALQPYLPQVLLVNERTVTAEQHRRWTSPPGCNAQVWRGKSAWINDKVFARIVRTLGKVLQERAPGKQAILLLDAHTCHFSPGTLAACRAYGIWPVIIPARMTSLLQPLDTHVFSRFKLFLRTCLHQMMLAGTNSELTSEQVLTALVRAIKGVLQRHAWAPAFSKNGFGQVFEVREHLLEALALPSTPCVSSGLPSYPQFAHCFPARKHIPFMPLLSGVLPSASRGHKRTRVDDMGDDTHADDVRPWATRLRPRLRGRVFPAVSRPVPAAFPLASASSAEMPSPPVAMISASGHPLPSLRRFPPRLRRSGSDLATGN